MAMYYTADNFVSRFYKENVDLVIKEEAINKLISDINDQLSTHAYRYTTEDINETCNTYRVDINFTLESILDMSDVLEVVDNFKNLGWRVNFAWLANHNSIPDRNTYRFEFQIFVNHIRGQNTLESFNFIND